MITKDGKVYYTIDETSDILDKKIRNRAKNISASLVSKNKSKSEKYLDKSIAYV